MTKILENWILPFLQGYFLVWGLILLTFVCLAALLFVFTVDSLKIEFLMSSFQKHFILLYINLYGIGFGVINVTEKNTHN